MLENKIVDAEVFGTVFFVTVIEIEKLHVEA